MSNFHAIAAAIVRETPDADPSRMVDAFVAQIDPEDYEAAVRYLARDLIRHAISGQRAALNGGAARTGSRKVDAVADAWKRRLDTPEFLPSSGWIFLRDATRDQVIEMAGLRRQKARELNASAKPYDAIAAEMQKAGVLRVADLGEPVLAQLLTSPKGAAA